MTPATPPAVVPVVATPGPLDRNPAAVYLRSKPSAAGRRGLARSLNRAAEVLTSGASKDALAVNWAEVRYQHVVALRAVLIENGAQPATINHVLSAVRGVIKETWRLGLLDAESTGVGQPTSKESQPVSYQQGATSTLARYVGCSRPAAIRRAGHATRPYWRSCTDAGCAAVRPSRCSSTNSTRAPLLCAAGRVGRTGSSTRPLVGARLLRRGSHAVARGPVRCSARLLRAARSSSGP